MSLVSADARKHLDEAAGHIMVVCRVNVQFLWQGDAFMGRMANGAYRTLDIELAPPQRPEWPQEGITPFGVWLLKRFRKHAWSICCLPVRTTWRTAREIVLIKTVPYKFKRSHWFIYTRSGRKPIVLWRRRAR